MLKLLKRYPRMEKLHELKVGDFEKRQEFASWVFRQIDIDENWLLNVLWTDEAQFTLNGEVNTQNSRIWATENPRNFKEMPLHQPRVIVWCGFTSSFIIGPFFFEEINGRTFKTVSVTGERYVQLLREKVIPILQDRQALSEITFMQDGGPPHISRGAKQLLKDTFGEDRVISHQWPSRSPDLTPCDFWIWGDVRAYLDQHVSGQWIGRRGPIEFPARSPDLTPLDFFLWGTVKDGVYKRKPRNLDILWNEIQAVCREISLDVLIRCTESVVTRTQNCIDAAGFHRRAKAKTSLEDDDVPIDDTTTKPLFTPQENGRKGTRDKVPRLRWNPWQRHVKSTSVSTIIASCGSQLP
ncbi:hypothetical protein LAZ67_16000433 [Cordylochernes scorpioides]|uniref:Transposase n=1 Tax=Cordylochernes scorpioides TaxID=51811 RepID=A0ABY6LDB4_9ARAC|nr:hypothetical protein LAZ67_16000433 [Cordylochernes scorpioides]